MVLKKNPYIKKKKKETLISAFKTLIKPIFIDLSNNSLREKSLHHKTQNVNESLNGLIWNRCPSQCTVVIIKIGVCSAIIAFNDGFYGLEKVFGKSTQEKATSFTWVLF